MPKAWILRRLLSMLHFGTSHEAGANCHDRKRYLIGIVALKYRTLAPFAQIFMDRALEIAKSFAKFAKDSMHRDLRETSSSISRSAGKEASDGG